VIRWPLLLVVILALGAAHAAQAQALNPADSKGLPSNGPYLPNPTGPAASEPNAAAPVNPYFASPTGAYASNPANYASTPESAKHRTGPQRSATAAPSGLSEAEAKTVLEDKGYRQVGNVKAKPNSPWAWQADAMKDGQPVRVGIDDRGNVLDLSTAQARSCTRLGVQPGAVGGLGIGSHLSQADSCSGQ
jgi:hypothetical protein